jgi:hypothetical protein
MGAATGPIASAAWILARACALTDPEARSATVAYGRSLNPITAPGRVPKKVTEFDATATGHDIGGAIDALAAGVGLARPGAARLLVIASDGYYRNEERAAGTARVARLRAAGCAMLWLAFAPDPTPFPGITVLELTDPAQAATAIGQAATRVLAAT